jgi:isoleucyl-tRNA synthetase
LFAEEKITHSYPHCWRCDTPLLNWAADSWFINVQKIKGKLLKQNAQVGWVPAHIGAGRFGKWLEGARDWAVSRSRYWGAPLPVWRHQKTKEVRVVGSVNELLSLAKRSGNRYFVMRHGEAKSNVEDILDSAGDPDNHLTLNGKAMARGAGAELKQKQIDLIVTSPFLRTRETASLVQQELGLSDSMVMVDERLRETGLGVYSGRPIEEWRKFFGTIAERFAKGPEGGESFTEVRRRVGEFLFDIERRYTGKNILIVSHGNPLWLMAQVAGRVPSAALLKENLPPKAVPVELPFVPFPHNADYELDLHRPFIDDFNTGEYKRARDVFDCWFESGSMPFASRGYPNNKDGFNPKGFFGLGRQGYPADFIAEGLDQTRGWFYSLIVLGTALFGKAPYKNVIVNGTVVTQSGEKMSKRLKNYPDPMEVVERYGADSLRYFLLSSPAVRGEDLRFNERSVEEVGKKLLMRLDNVRSFYELYAPADSAEKKSPAPPLHILDRWILSRLGQLVTETTAGFESYELDAAARPLGAFIDDLSTWYVRRSRERFKAEGKDKAQALATLREALMTAARVMAPLMPFFADDLYRRLRAPDEPESVHLAPWPEALPVDEALIKDMNVVRQLASKGLELREKAGIKVRQPLGRFEAPAVPQSAELRALLGDELNVKEIIENPSLKEAVLDLELTPELREEGMYREFVRKIQDWRKEAGLHINDRPGLLIKTPDQAAFLKKFKDALRDATGLLSLEVKEDAADSFERL